MGWFSLSKKRADAQPKVRTEDMWTVCPSCNAHIFKEEWQKANKVCSQCGFHDRLSSRERIDLLLDAGSFHELAREVGTSDPLAFEDAKGKYVERVEEAKKTTGMKEAVVAGRGKMDGRRVVLAVMDFRFMGGSLGSGTGERILRAMTFAVKQKMPCIVVSASGGARMHEGIVSLMQMVKTCAGVARLNEAKVPYISVMTHPTTGGVSASFAMVGDVNISEPGALIGFAGRRVIEQTIKQKLPDDFQTAEYVLNHGFIDRIVHRNEMKSFIVSVLRYWGVK